MSASPAQRTQEQRRSATREALLDATVSALARYGYAGTTTTLVSQIAGVSRGAQVHHFHTRADLFAAAIPHVAARRATELLREAGELPAAGVDRTTVALDLLWRSHHGPLLLAAMELWIAARTDVELRVRLSETEADLAAGVETFCAVLFGADRDDPQFAEALRLALSAIRGAVLLAHLEDRGSDDWPTLRAQLATHFPITQPPSRSTTL